MKTSILTHYSGPLIDGIHAAEKRRQTAIDVLSAVRNAAHDMPTETREQRRAQSAAFVAYHEQRAALAHIGHVATPLGTARLSESSLLWIERTNGTLTRATDEECALLGVTVTRTEHSYQPYLTYSQRREHHIACAVASAMNATVRPAETDEEFAERIADVEDDAAKDF